MSNAQTAGRLTPNDLRLIDRFGSDVEKIAAYFTDENRMHATGHGVADPQRAAEDVVDRYESATRDDFDRCNAVNDRINRELGIAR